MMGNIFIWILLTCLCLQLTDECQDSQNGHSYVCKEETVCMRWEIARAGQEVTRIFVAHNNAQYIDQNWAELPLIHEPRASISWNKNINSDRIDLQIQNTTLFDKGKYHLDMYIGNVFTPYTTTLHVLTACPDREMYQHPQIYYQFPSQDKVLLNNGVIELTEPGHLTILVTVPAAVPSVQAAIVFGQSRYNCTGRAGNHSVCEAALSIDGPGDTKVIVTLTFMAWTWRTSVITIQIKLTNLTVSTTHVPLFPTTSAINITALGNTETSPGGLAAAVLCSFAVIVAICFAGWHCRRRRRVMREQRERLHEQVPLTQDALEAAMIPKQRVAVDYLTALRTSVAEKVHLKNKALNRPFRIDSDKLFYVDLVMSQEQRLTSHNTAEVEDYWRRTAQSFTTKETISIENMFKPEGGGEEPRRVLLMGGAGMGKTTVSQEHIRMLAATKNTEIQAPYHFECRCLTSHILNNKEHSLADLLFERHQPSNMIDKKKESILEQLLPIQNQIHITIDGLDELPRWETCSAATPEIHSVTEKAEIHVIIYNLIHKHLLPKAKVLVTTRPISSVKPRDKTNSRTMQTIR